jgi:hypothetical protein
VVTQILKNNRNSSGSSAYKHNAAGAFAPQELSDIYEH